MITVKLISVGNLKEDYLKKAFAEYEKRLSGLCRFEAVELKEHKLGDNPSDTEILSALDEESRRILPLLTPKAYKIALCVEGTQFSSEEFAKIINTASLSHSEIVFVIGSSFGLSDKVKAACDLKLSLSKMTFPHQLFRVIIAESIYRTFNILKGTKYHK